MSSPSGNGDPATNGPGSFPRLTRRQVLRATASVATALLAACSTKTATDTPSPVRPFQTPLPGGTSAPTPAPTVIPTPLPAPSSAAAGSPVAAATAPLATTTAPTTGASVMPPAPATVAATGRAGSTTPQPATARSDLLRMLAFVPDQADLLQQDFLTFANVAAVKRLYGYEAIRSTADLDARNVSTTEYDNVTRGCPLSLFTGQRYSVGGTYRDLFGYDAFQVDREISLGQPPNDFSHMEGAFDARAVEEKLKEGGYTAAARNGVPFFTVRDDFQIFTSDPRGRLALARMNRVAVNGTRIIAGPSTDIINATIDAETKMTGTLDANPAWRALAIALGNVAGMQTTSPTLLDPIIAVKAREQVGAMTRDWGTLHVPELTAFGYTDAGKFQRTMHVALVYRNPADAAADAPELVKRIMGYRSTFNLQPLIPTFVTKVTSRVVNESGKGVLIADLVQVPEPALAGFWSQSVTLRDTLYLVPDVSVLRGTAAPGTVTGGSPTARPTTRP